MKMPGKGCLGCVKSYIDERRRPIFCSGLAPSRRLFYVDVTRPINNHDGLLAVGPGYTIILNLFALLLSHRRLSPLIRVADKVLDGILHGWREEVALDGRDAAWGLGGKDVDTDDVAGGFGAF
jgi:hypothetical protein